MPDAVLVCGQAMGLRDIARHRLFESSVPLMSPGCACDGKPKASVFGHSGQDRRKPPRVQTNGRPLWAPVLKADAAALLGVQWMTNRDDISDAIPPAYTEYIGEQLLAHLAVTS